MDDSKLHPLLPTIFQDMRDQCVFDGDVHQVYIIRNFAHRRISSETLDIFGFGIDRIDGTLKIVIEKIGKNNMTDA
jgi:hypothetical protein